MRKLLLIRHAKSSWEYPELSDHDRPLNKRGQQNALMMAARLLNNVETLDVVLSSTAVRALGIAKAIADALDITLITEPGLYTFSSHELLSDIQSLPDEYKRVGIVGHNPAITDLANVLSGESVDNVPTSGIVSLECPIDSWPKIVTDSCRLIELDFPKRQ